ncbi:MAG: aspartate 1-decarboxylase [Fimbriimonadaceae bacterium]|nr:aspartate 1-decarboxylase [Fimbriimonadaceae bacterium]
MLKAKLHHAHITYANPEYVGSIEVDGELLRRVGIQDGELVHVWSVDGTSRIQTYAFSGPSGVVGINGGAAHLFKAGERVIIAAFTLTDEEVVPEVLLLDGDNRVVREMNPFHVLG